MWKYIIIAILWVWTENYILSKLQITGKKRIVIKIVTLIILVIILYFILSYFNPVIYQLMIGVGAIGELKLLFHYYCFIHKP